MKSNFCFDSTNVKSTCPICRNDKFVSFPQHEADREIKGLLIYCPNKESGCEWVGELNDLHKHIKDGKCCDVICDKCDKTLPSTGVKSHLDTECPCYCPYCDITAEREMISSEHKEKCHKFPLTCPNNCGLDNIPRDNMDEHKKVCPLEVIQCEYCDVGCTTVMPRRDQKQHNSENFYRFHHLQLACRNQTTQAITTAASFTTVHYFWLQLVCIFLVVLIIQAVIIKVDYSSRDMKLFEHIQQNYPSLLWSVFLNESSAEAFRGNQVAPVILKLSDFSEKLKQKKRWDSSPFFAFEGGYQMRLRIHPIDVSMYDRFFLSASLYVMQGPYDNALEHLGDQQLFEGTFTIELLNQLSDNDHITNVVTLSSEICIRCTKIMGGEIVRKWGYSVLVPHNTFLHKDNSEYVRSNSLYFRISHKKADSIYDNPYYYYIMQYLISPSIAGVSVILMAVIIQLLHTFISFDIDIYTAYSCFLYCAALGSIVEGSIPAGVTWALLYFLIFGTIMLINKLDENQDFITAFLTLALGGCLARIFLVCLLFIWDVICIW